MLKVTKFLSLHNEFFGQEIPIQNHALMRIRITFHGNALSVFAVTSVMINVGSLSRIPFKSAFRTLIIALMCPSKKIPKEIVDEDTR